MCGESKSHFTRIDIILSTFEDLELYDSVKSCSNIRQGIASVIGVKDVNSQIREMKHLSEFFISPKTDQHHIKDLFVFSVYHVVCLAKTQEQKAMLINCIHSILVMAISNGCSEAIESEHQLNMRILFFLKRSQEKGYAQIDKLNTLGSNCVVLNSKYYAWYNHWLSLAPF